MVTITPPTAEGKADGPLPDIITIPAYAQRAVDSLGRLARLAENSEP